MGWVSEDDNRLDGSERCTTTKVVKSQCRIEAVVTGKFIKKCEKTEELLRNCVGKPVEVLQSNKEYTEEDITDEVLKGGSVPYNSPNSSSDRDVFGFPGLRNDIEVMERGLKDMEQHLFGGLGRFFEAAEEMKNGFFDVFAKTPHIFGEESSTPSTRGGIPIEEHRRPEAIPKSEEKESADRDFTALAKDV
ncbi:hypothetical protein RJT34_19511 [Clitoria ternatea]|uniref:Mal d 1-associated protein n=1 Tax=Clitoria ternatea TaxID=43366 RepID=A0AAN9IRK5_CLITE